MTCKSIQNHIFPFDKLINFFIGCHSYITNCDEIIRIHHVFNCEVHLRNKKAHLFYTVITS